MKNRSIGIVLSYLNTGMDMVCGLFLSSFLLRMLGDTEYGIYQTIASFANYLILLEFGTGTVMTRNISMCRGGGAEREEIQRNVTSIWMLAWILAAVIAAVAAVFYLSIDSIYAATLDLAQRAHAKNIFLLVTVYLLCSFLMQTLNGVILAYEHYRFGAVQKICRTVLRTGLLVGLVSMNRSSAVIACVDAVLSAVLLIVSAGYVLKNFHIRLRPGKMNAAVVRTALPLAAALFLQTIVNQANNNVDKFLIGIMLSPQSVSLYSVAMYIYSIFSSLTTIPISMYAPSVGKWMQQKTQTTQLEKHLVAPCRMVAFTGGMIYFGFIAMGRPFVELVYGDKYAQAWIIAVIVMTPMYLNMINGVLINVLDALNKRMVRSVALIATTAANIALTVIWLKLWGVVGAALATALCTFLGQVLIMNVYYHKKLKINVLYLFREALRGILPWMLIGCAAALWVGSLTGSLVWTLVVRCVLFCGITLGGYLIRGISEWEKQLLKRLLRREAA